MTKERVLIVDDDPTVRKVLARVVERSGLEVCVAASGEEALSPVSRWYKNCGLPKMTSPS